MTVISSILKTSLRRRRYTGSSGNGRNSAFFCSGHGNPQGPSAMGRRRWRTKGVVRGPGRPSGHRGSHKSKSLPFLDGFPGVLRGFPEFRFGSGERETLRQR